jgi:hypothetical protein
MRKVLFAFVLGSANVAVPANAAYLYGFSGIGPVAEQLVLNGTTSIDADNAGWFYEDGTHQSFNDNYAVGYDVVADVDGLAINGELRNFLGFSLAAFTQTVTSASVRIVLEQGATDVLPTADGLPAEWRLYDVLTEPEFRLAYNGATSIFADLGTGVTYGAVTQTATSGVVEVALNASAIAAINASLGTRFVVGGKLTPAIAAVPESTTWAMMLIGFGGMGFVLRRSHGRKLANA